MRLLSTLILSTFVLFSCISTPEKAQQIPEETAMAADGVQKVKTLEVIQTSSYTYLRVDENGQEIWIAVTKLEANIGDEFYISGAFEMKDFESKELNRVFPSVFFVQNISTNPGEGTSTNTMPASSSNGELRDSSLTIEPAKGGISIAEIYKNRNKYAGKKVIVKGKATKVNNNIMDKNWVHIQDGSSNNQNFDLTITTAEMVNVGDVVTFEGKIYLDKDFGSGYSYELIMEEAVKK